MLWASANVASGQELIRESKNHLLWKRTFVVSPSEFRRDLLEENFRRTVATEGRGAAIVQVEVFTDQQEARNGNCKCVTDVSYRQWSGMYTDYMRRGMPEVAKLIIIRESASMQVRDRNGRIYSSGLATKESLTIGAGSCRAEVLDIRRSSVHADAAGGVWFYLMSKQPSLECGTALLTALQSAVGTENVSLSVRNDPWFITSDSFPIVHYFLPGVPHPPSFAAYRKSRDVLCSYSNRAECRWVLHELE